MKATVKAESGAHDTVARLELSRDYSSICNQGGRIGIYLPAARKKLLAKFHAKRKRRVWNKKIRYGCRKQLADSRVRIKGRFVKKERMRAGEAAAEQAVQPLNGLLMTTCNREPCL